MFSVDHRRTTKAVKKLKEECNFFILKSSITYPNLGLFNHTTSKQI
jgi:hypothetical protein